jgi:hypothetical protein
MGAKSSIAVVIEFYDEKNDWAMRIPLDSAIENKIPNCFTEKHLL